MPESPAPEPAAPTRTLEQVGVRLVGDDAVPAWMRPLLRAVDGMRMPEGWMRQAAVDARLVRRHSAVLMLLGEGPDGPDLLLTARAATLRSHAGQPAFPGGALDPGEDDVTASLREGQEETGLDPASVLPAALLPQLFLPPSGNLVRPVLAHWHSPGAVSAVDPGETAAVARVPLAELADPANRGHVRILDGRNTGPAFRVAGLTVWGFTGGLVDLLVRAGGWEVPWDRDRRFDLPALR